MAEGKWRRRWQDAKRALTWLFLIAMAVLLFVLLRNTNWHEVWHAFDRYTHETLILGLAISILGYAVFSSFDLLSRFYIGHSLPIGRVYTVAFICNAFNLNLGSWVGAVALRYRLYSKLGLNVPDITRILSFSLITNWYGYLWLAGILFTMGQPSMPSNWKIDNFGLQLIGPVLLLICVAYLLACLFSRKRTWHFRNHHFSLPSWRLALIQGLVGMTNWALMALLIKLLLPDSVSYFTVLAILLISSIAGVIAHVPAGLGVLEAVFIALLHGEVGRAAVMAALIGYRVLYFLIPLAIAFIVYIGLERYVAATRKRARQDATAVAES